MPKRKRIFFGWKTVAMMRAGSVTKVRKMPAALPPTAP